MSIRMTALALALFGASSGAWAQAPVTKLSEIQGVTPAAGAEKFASPMAKKNVHVRAIVTQVIATPTRGGELNHGFFLQDGKADADGNPATSDGIFVFNSKFSTVRIKGPDKQAKYTPKAGDEIELDAQVAEFHDQTQLTQPWVTKVVRQGVNLDAEVPAVDLKPPLDEKESAAYWERLEGMRVSVPAGAVAQAGLHPHERSGDWITWLVRADQLPNLDNKDAYSHRLFRDSHPLDNKPERFDDGNAQRIITSSFGLMGKAGDASARLPLHHTFARTKSAMTGCVAFTFDQFRFVPDAIEFESGIDPSANQPPAEPKRDQEFSIALYNVENLYDLRNNPFSLNDAAGEPGQGSIKPPFNYLPQSEADYETHVTMLARQIIGDLHAPDVILGQEFEAQDIAKLEGGKLVEGTERNADGRPDTAQDLILAIKAAGGPEYDCAWDPMAGDTRGITTVFLYRTDRVQLGTEKDSPMLSATPPVKYATPPVTTTSAKLPVRAINAQLPPSMASEDDELEGRLVCSRAPQLALFRIYKTKAGEGEPTLVFAVNNHFSSRPNARVAQRIEQARLNAAIMTAIRTAHPKALALMGGDLNIYPRPDDPFPAKPSDQLAALYDAGLANLWDTLVKDVPASAYSYVYDGQAQTLDQMFVTPELKGHLAQARVAHINSDYAEAGAHADASGPARRASDHDSLVARFSFNSK